jgi:hypothetical protein
MDEGFGEINFLAIERGNAGKLLAMLPPAGQKVRTGQ